MIQNEQKKIERLRWTADEWDRVLPIAAQLHSGGDPRRSIFLAQTVLPPDRRREEVRTLPAHALTAFTMLVSELRLDDREPTTPAPALPATPLPAAQEDSAPGSSLANVLASVSRFADSVNAALAALATRLDRTSADLEALADLLAESRLAATPPASGNAPSSPREPGAESSPALAPSSPVRRVAIAGVTTEAFRQMEADYRGRAELRFIDADKSPSFSANVDAFVCGRMVPHKLTAQAMSVLGRNRVVRFAGGGPNQVRRVLDELLA